MVQEFHLVMQKTTTLTVANMNLKEYFWFVVHLRDSCTTWDSEDTILRFPSSHSDQSAAVFVLDHREQKNLIPTKFWEQQGRNKKPLKRDQTFSIKNTTERLGELIQTEKGKRVSQKLIIAMQSFILPVANSVLIISTKQCFNIFFELIQWLSKSRNLSKWYLAFLSIEPWKIWKRRRNWTQTDTQSYQRDIWLEENHVFWSSDWNRTRYPDLWQTDQIIWKQKTSNI